MIEASLHGTAGEHHPISVLKQVAPHSQVHVVKIILVSSKCSALLLFGAGVASLALFVSPFLSLSARHGNGL